MGMGMGSERRNKYSESSDVDEKCFKNQIRNIVDSSLRSGSNHVESYNQLNHCQPSLSKFYRENNTDTYNLNKA